MLRYLTVILLFVTTPCIADIRLPKILGSKMVLQRESEVKIWGWADPGEMVSVNCDWLDKPQTVKADAKGNWQVSVKTEKAGGPYEITFSGKNEIKLDEILFGEVWIASGQSNMEMPVTNVSGAYTGVKNFKKEITDADHPEIRLFQAGNFSSIEPLDDVETGIIMYGVPLARCEWAACTPKTIPTFASTAYFFARELQKELNVPIGIIDSSWGGTSAEVWTPTSGLKKLGYTSELQQATSLKQNANQKIPTRLYNGMIHPLRNFQIKGVIWYQGESNAKRANQYSELFSTMISEWRAVFNNEFPFYFVQISPFNYGNVNSAFLREAQLKTMSLQKTGMAVTMDIGNLTDIHPKNKQEVGRRLALWALAHDYGRAIEYSGPIYKSSQFTKGQARLKFDHVGGGLATRDGKAPSHFEIAGDDKVFHPAIAMIKANELVVSSSKVAAPKAVRYAFSNKAMPNLINKAGLPASSFRTDDWKQE